MSHLQCSAPSARSAVCCCAQAEPSARCSRARPLLGSPFAAHLDPRDRDRIVVELARLTSGAERSWEGEGRLRAADGGVVRVRLEAGVLPGAGGAAATIAVRLVELAAAFGDAAADRAEPGARSAGARPARACE